MTRLLRAKVILKIELFATMFRFKSFDRKLQIGTSHVPQYQRKQKNIVCSDWTYKVIVKQNHDLSINFRLEVTKYRH